FTGISNGFPVIFMVLYALGVNLFVASLVLHADYALSAHLESRHLRLKPAATPETARRRASRVLTALYAAAIAATAVLPSLYTPTPDHAAGPFSAWWLAFFLPSVTSSSWIFSVYPAFPWLAPTLLGLLIGRLAGQFRLSVQRQALLCMALGVGFLAVFVPLRLAGGFGNINPGLLDPPPHRSIINFFNMVKYPPSLVYLLCTLGTDLAVLALLLLLPPLPTPAQQQVSRAAAAAAAVAGPLLAFGGSALFFFVTHMLLYFGMGGVLRLSGVMPATGFSSAPAFWTCYAVGLAIEFVWCRRYAAFKRTTNPESVWRFF
ncbi:hypothetical protein HK405_004989, partial [Cladochytrium tenue]